MSTLTDSMNPDFSVGDTADCHFGQVTWRDPDHIESRRYDDDDDPKIYRISSVARTDSQLTIKCEWPKIL